MEVKHDNRIWKEEVSRIQSDYDLLVEKYTALRNEMVYESVINSLEFQDRIDQLVNILTILISRLVLHSTKFRIDAF